MDIFLILLGLSLIIIGLLGSVLPVIPGPPLSFAGLLALHFTSKFEFSFTLLLIYGILMILIIILEYVIPIYGTKKMGGTKYGMWGSTIGLIAGLFVFPPFGLIIGPFIGAFIGELIYGKTSEVALRSAVGSFLGFIFSTLLKLIYCFLIIYHVVVQLFIYHQ